MAMASSEISLPLYERVTIKNTKARAIELFILSLFLSLLVYRVLSFKDHGLAWILAFSCEVWFTFNWAITVSTKWNQVSDNTFPRRLLHGNYDLPSVDMFVTTADHVLEPPIITVNTVLSLLAVDYPADKLACYVSDDGGSPLTFYSLVETSKFAKIWVPFCKKYNVQVRAPFRYFLDSFSFQCNNSSQFNRDWQNMKNEYERLIEKIEDAAKKVVPCDLSGEFSDFLDIKSKSHSSIIKVIWENKEYVADGVPHLVYVSREKHPMHPHHYKAGAMNVLTRVSAVMTNAPIMLNVDCDMYVNNSQTFLHAMCLLLGVANERDCAFVQFPQYFYDGLKDDPFGNQFRCLHEYIWRGIVGIQGPWYAGTGCFHRRKVIYGLSPYDQHNKDKLSKEALEITFGRSLELAKSTVQILSGVKSSGETHDLLSAIEPAFQVAACGYENDTSWGNELGWIYGSVAEDMLTGMTIHGRGWKTKSCDTKPRAFLGCAPSGGPASMSQYKRWATGLLEICLSFKNPIFQTINGKLQFRMCLAYSWLLQWGLWSIPELCYALLPAYCIFTDSHFLPKVGEVALWIPINLFIIINIYSLYEYLRAGLSVREWWNNLRMWRVTAMNAFLLGIFSALLKLLGISDIVFEITRKDQPNTVTANSTDKKDDGKNSNAANGRFTFDDSPVFIPATTVLLVNLIALAKGLLQGGSGIGEVGCSFYVVLLLWTFFKGLFGKGIYGIPFPTLYKSGALAFLFVNLGIYWRSLA